MKKNDTIKKDTKALRVINWAFSIALILGSLMMIIQATAKGTLLIFLFLAIAIAAYTLSAILLYSGLSKIVTIPIVIDKENKLLYKISIGANFLCLLLGVGIILGTVYVGQYIVGVLGFIFTLLSYSNIKALDSSVKELD